MVPLTLVSLVGLSVAALCVKPEGIEVRFPEKQTIRRPRQLWLMAVLFLLCLLSVFHVLHYAVLLAIVAVCLLLFARHLFPRVDYGLLFTFVCFFIFAGNIGNIPAVKDFLSAVMAENTFITSLCASQVISNVPAAVLLSGFTEDWKGLLLGTDVGGLGTLIASLAIDCGVKVNILGADTRNMDGKAFGTMLLGLPKDPKEAGKALDYIKSQPDITVEEVSGHA